MDTGRKVDLLVLGSNTNRAADAGTFQTEILGSILLAFGVGCFYVALSVLPVTRVTWIALVGSVGWAGFKLHSRWRKHGASDALSAWKVRKQQELQHCPIRPAEEIATPTEGTAHERLSPTLPPVLALVGIILLALGFYAGHNVLHLTQTGRRAPGMVVGMALGTGSSDESTYHAIVRFSPDEATNVEFQDSVGTNPPSHRAGDAVTVLYSPDSPQRSAIIDRRMWNWLPATGLFVFGILLIALGGQIRRKQRSRDGQVANPARIHHSSST